MVFLHFSIEQKVCDNSATCMNYDQNLEKDNMDKNN